MNMTVNIDLLKQWSMQGLDLNAVIAELRAGGMDEETLKNYMEAYKKYKVSKKQFKGFVLMGLGAFLGFVSCVLSLVNPIPELYNLILFGLTSLAIIIIVAGMYFLFE